MAKQTSVLRGVHSLIRETKQNERVTPIELLFLNSLESSIIKSNTTTRLPTKTYKPSSMVCMRQMYYQVRGMGEGLLTDIPSPSNVGILQSGSARHDQIQTDISKMVDYGYNWEYIDVETYIKEYNVPDLVVIGKRGMETKLHHNKYNMNFQTDGILKYTAPDGTPSFYIFEFKTEVQEKFNFRTGVDPKHYEQATAYSLSFGIDKVIFLYENRNNCTKKSYLLEVTDEMVNDLVNKLGECDKCVDIGLLPPKTTQKRVCYWCKYKDLCADDYNG